MKAYTKYRYGGPEALQLEEIEKPPITPGHLLVKIQANSANPADWHTLRGDPFIARFAFGLLKPKERLFGADFAGEVVEIGANVKQFKPGDRVYGENLESGSFCEYALASEKVCCKIPEGVSAETMAAVPIAGLTALQAIVTHGKVKPDERVLINGASGGVGHFAIQIAKANGAHVTGVCSSRNIDFVAGLGADEVIAYDQQNIHQHQGNYDLVLDTNGNLNFEDFKRVGKRGVLIGFTSMNHMIATMLKSVFSKFPLIQFTAKANNEDLETLATMVKKGDIKPQIEKIYPYQQIPEAIGYIEKMRTRGKVVMVWE